MGTEDLTKFRPAIFKIAIRILVSNTNKDIAGWESVYYSLHLVLLIGTWWFSNGIIVQM